MSEVIGEVNEAGRARRSRQRPELSHEISRRARRVGGGVCSES